MIIADNYAFVLILSNGNAWLNFWINYIFIKYIIVSKSFWTGKYVDTRELLEIHIIWVFWYPNKNIWVMSESRQVVSGVGRRNSGSSLIKGKITPFTKTVFILQKTFWHHFNCFTLIFLHEKILCFIRFFFGPGPASDSFITGIFIIL